MPNIWLSVLLKKKGFNVFHAKPIKAGFLNDFIYLSQLEVLQIPSVYKLRARFNVQIGRYRKIQYGLSAVYMSARPLTRIPSQVRHVVYRQGNQPYTPYCSYMLLGWPDFTLVISGYHSKPLPVPYLVHWPLPGVCRLAGGGAGGYHAGGYHGGLSSWCPIDTPGVDVKASRGRMKRVNCNIHVCLHPAASHSARHSTTLHTLKI